MALCNPVQKMTQQTPVLTSQGKLIRPAILAGWFYVPFEAFPNRAALEAEKKRLTFTPTFAEEDSGPIQLFREFPARGYLGVPIAYGRVRFSWLKVDDRRTLGAEIQRSPRLPSPNHHRVKEPEKQAKFMQDVLAASHKFEHFTAKAATGSGKTVVALWLAQQLLRRTLIMVPLERLLVQWVEEIKDKLGLPESRIGIIQGPTCQFEDRDIVVGMMPSLAMHKTYPRELYSSFGFIVADECHRIGSSVLSQIGPMFNPKYRMALSATPNRKDGGDRVPYWHFGPIRVTSNAAALECTVYVKRYRANVEKYPLYGNHSQSRAKCLSQDPVRNRMLVDLIVRNYRMGRKILVIGKFVAHLQDLMEACGRAGIPPSLMGQYTGQVHVRETVMTDSGPKRVTKKAVKVQKSEYDRMKAESQILFATYGVFKEGIDIPHLDCGIDVLPQSDAEQVIGRIRRPMEGKPTPYWVTVLDTECKFSQRMFEKRCHDYRKTGCRIVDNGKL